MGNVLWILANRWCAAVRALANPELFKYDHFRQAALAIAIGIVIQLIIQIPVRF